MPGPIQSVERAAAILEVLASGPSPLRLAEVSVALRLPKGTVHGILRTLEAVGFVRQDRRTGCYQLGSALTSLGSGIVDVNEMRARSLNWADPLAARSGEAVRVGMLSVIDVLIVHSVFRPDDSPQTSDVRTRLPAHTTALGQVLLAYQPGALARLPDTLERYAPRSIVDRQALDRRLVDVRRRHYAVEFREHLSEQASIAAPILGHGGLVVAAVAIHGHTDRICDGQGIAQPRLVRLVTECAHAITRELENDRSTR